MLFHPGPLKVRLGTLIKSRSRTQIEREAEKAENEAISAVVATQRWGCVCATYDHGGWGGWRSHEVMMWKTASRNSS